jgi:ribonuclease J
MMKRSLRLISLGGTEDVNKNMFIYESNNDILIIDCGLDFPEPDGKEGLIIPDISYLLGKKEKVRGILVTHGHEDHFGALPYILPKISVPVYSTRLVSGFIEDSLKDFNLVEKTKLNVFDPEKDILNLGCFKITPFRVNHSVPDSVGFVLETPVGKIFHVSDFKFDWTPVMDRPFDVSKIACLSREGVLALCSDCLGVHEEGYTRSEKDIEKAFLFLLSQAEDQVFITTVSSNISRIKQAINASRRFNRKVVLLGRSIEQKVKIARRLGYLKISSQDLISSRKARRLPPKMITYIAAGSYGQIGSALWRVAYNDRSPVSLRKGALVIFSADPSPPGAKLRMGQLIDQIIGLGASVRYYETQEDLHVSGHGSRGDLSLMARLVNPQYFIPIGGTIRHMCSYAELITGMGYKSNSVFELPEGQILEFSGRSPRLGERIKLQKILVKQPN